MVGLFPEALAGAAVESGGPIVATLPIQPARAGPSRPAGASAAGLRMKLEQRCQEIELILADVDGVLTDGHIIFNNQGIETKQFHIRDGMGIRLWQRAGYRFGLITGRSSHIVKIRAAELGIDIVRQTAEDKLPVAQEILAQLGLALHQVCYIGDDLPDLPVMRAVGLGVAVADACAEVRQAAHYVTQLAGRPRRGARNDRDDPQSPAPLGRPDPKVHPITSAIDVATSHIERRFRRLVAPDQHGPRRPGGQ